MSTSTDVTPLPPMRDVQEERSPTGVGAERFSRRGTSPKSADKTADEYEKHHYPAAQAGEDLPSWLHGSAAVTLSSPIGQHVVNVVLQLAGIVAAIAFGYFAVQSVQIANRANAEAHLANQIAIYALCNSNNNIPSAGLPQFCDRINGDANNVLPKAATALFTATPPAPTTSASSAFPSATHVPSSSTSKAGASDTLIASSSTSSISTGPVSTASPTVGSDSSSGESSHNRSRTLAIAIAVPVGVLLIMSSAFILCCRSRRRRRIRRADLPMRGNGWSANAVQIQDHGVQSHSSRPSRSSSPVPDEARPLSETRLSRWWRIYRNLFVDSTVLTREEGVNKRLADKTNVGTKSEERNIIDSTRPTYMKVHRGYLSPDTLDLYGLPWEWYSKNKDYILIKQWVGEEDQQILFEHTRKLRESSLLDEVTVRPPSAQVHNQESSDAVV